MWNLRCFLACLGRAVREDEVSRPIQTSVISKRPEAPEDPDPMKYPVVWDGFRVALKNRL